MMTAMQCAVEHELHFFQLTCKKISIFLNKNKERGRTPHFQI